MAVVLGKDSLDDTLPRSIPVADVKLVESIKVREHNEHITKDVYSKIFKSSSFETSDINEYERLKQGTLRDNTVSSIRGAAGVTERKTPKFFVELTDTNHPSLILIGNALMLEPQELDQATTLNNSAANSPFSGNTLFRNGSDTFGDQTRTWETNTWSFADVGVGSFTDGGWKEAGPGNLKDSMIVRSDVENIWRSIVSDFSLLTNQPFGISFTIPEAKGNNQDAADVFWSGAATGRNAPTNFTSFYPKKVRKSAALEISWGSKSETGQRVTLVFYKNGTFSAFIDQTSDSSAEEIDESWAPINTYTLPKSATNNKDTHLSFFPQANKIYVYATNAPSKQATADGQYITITLPDVVRLEEGPIFVTSYLGKTKFSFNPVVFSENGRLRSPVIQTNFSEAETLLNLAFLGKVGVGVRESPITFPQTSDTGGKDGDALWQYLENTRITYEINAEDSDEGSGAFTYDMTLASNPASMQVQNGAGIGEASDDSSRVQSPAVFQAQFIAIPDLEDVSMNPTPQIDNEDVMNISITDTVEGSSCSIVLNNRKPSAEARQSLPSFGNYTFRPGVNNFTGVKPIRASFGWEGETTGLNQVQHFEGFVVKRSYSRGGPTQSTCTLACEDRSKQLKETFAVNLPIYDGWCHLAVIYDLAREAGFDDDEILFFEDPLTGSRTTIRSMLVGDPSSRAEGCFDGHVESFPQGSNFRGGLNLPGAFIHQTLPLAPLHEAPNFMFQMGSSLWDCMQQVRQHSFWYLFCNTNGNLIYSPPARMIKDRGKKFVEVDVRKDFNEFQRTLSADFDTAEQRNAVIVWGLIPTEDGRGNPTWAPDVHVRKEKDWPRNVGDPSYYPWLRWVLMRNPKWNDHERNRAIADETFRRVRREKIFGVFGAWGQPELFPYEVITLDEGQAGETGVNGRKFIVTSITHNLNADGFTFDSDVTCELFDPDFADFDPLL